MSKVYNVEIKYVDNCYFGVVGTYCLTYDSDKIITFKINRMSSNGKNWKPISNYDMIIINQELDTTKIKQLLLEVVEEKIERNKPLEIRDEQDVQKYTTELEYRKKDLGVVQTIIRESVKGEISDYTVNKLDRTMTRISTITHGLRAYEDNCNVLEEAEELLSAPLVEFKANSTGVNRNGDVYITDNHLVLKRELENFTFKGVDLAKEHADTSYLYRPYMPLQITDGFKEPVINFKNYNPDKVQKELDVAFHPKEVDLSTSVPFSTLTDEGFKYMHKNMLQQIADSYSIPVELLTHESKGSEGRTIIKSFQQEKYQKAPEVITVKKLIEAKEKLDGNCNFTNHQDNNLFVLEKLLKEKLLFDGELKGNDYASLRSCIRDARHKCDFPIGGYTKFVDMICAKYYPSVVAKMKTVLRESYYRDNNGEVRIIAGNRLIAKRLRRNIGMDIYEFNKIETKIHKDFYAGV